MEQTLNDLRILVVEDNPGDYFLITEYLEEHSKYLEVSHAENFATARQILQNHTLHFDIILLDLSLPDMSGSDLISGIIALAVNTPVVILTGRVDLAFSIQALQMGITDYLLKDSLTGNTLFKSIVYSINHQKALLSLRESEQRYSQLFQLSPQAMLVYDTESMKILAVNNAAIELYGFHEHEFMQISVSQLGPVSYEEESEAGVSASGTADLGHSEIIDTHHKKNGQVFQAQVHSNKINYSGRPARIIIVDDITERIKHQEAISLQNKKLREIAWMQSHLVRAPLANIMGLIALLEDETTDASENKQLMVHMNTAAKQLDATLRSIISRADQIEMKF